MGQWGLKRVDLVGKMPCHFFWTEHIKQGILNGSFVGVEVHVCYLCNSSSISGYTVKKKHRW